MAVTFQDDFNDGWLDRSKWAALYDGGTGNGCAFRWDASGVEEWGGQLHLYNRWDGSGWAVGGAATIPNQWHPGFAQTYGTFEVRARVADGEGTGACVLLWPADNSWPPEIDLLETPRDTVAFFNHFPGGGEEGGSFRNWDASDWHTYRLEWAANRLAYFVDGALLYETRDPAKIPDQPMSVGLQGFVAGWWDDHWYGAPDATTPWVTAMDVDWVRVSDHTGSASASPQAGNGVADHHQFEAWGGRATIAGFEVGLDRLTATTAYGYVPWIEADTAEGTYWRYGWGNDVVFLPGVRGATAAELASGQVDHWHFDAWSGRHVLEDFDYGVDRVTFSTAYGYRPWIEGEDSSGTWVRYGWNDDVVLLKDVWGVTAQAVQEPWMA